ncbi:sulfotransferase [Amphritea sp.]|uniref:sulfotransferase n=1 Tax=Amphritea sp. TaxID=1872502 RepID=UPI003D105E00
MIFSATKNRNPSAAHRQFIVVGVQRGGTSAIAASLKALGVSLGDNFHEPIYEDIGMAEAFRAGNWKKLQKLIVAYEQKYVLFAWKLPDSNSKLTRVSKLFSNPSFIFVYRDIFAIAKRKKTVHDTDISAAMSSSLSAYNRILKFVDKSHYPALHISYEKLLQDKQGHLKELAAFCHLEASEDLIERACKSIEASPRSYTQWVEISRQIIALNKAGFDGYIDHVSESLISGWMLKSGSDQPVTLELFVNDKLITEFLCDTFRGDLITAAKSNTGNAGFSIPLPEGTLKKSDRISLKPTGHSVGLFTDF